MENLDFCYKNDELLKDDYILWLMSFSKKHQVFSVSELLENPDSLSKEDFENIKKFPKFHEIISRYAFNNFLVFSRYANIKYNDFYFTIIVFNKKGKKNYCFALTNKEAENFEMEYNGQTFLDFKLVQEMQNLPETETIAKTFDSIKDDIIELCVCHKLSYGAINEHLQLLFHAIYS